MVLTTGSTLDGMDGELRDYVQSQVAHEAGLPPEWATRLHGSTLSELRTDAKALAHTLGVAEPEPARERSADGRYAAGAARINSELRRAAGR
jgi:hypothetical protein